MFYKVSSFLDFHILLHRLVAQHLCAVCEGSARQSAGHRGFEDQEWPFGRYRG